ncbi:MAG: thiazole synthase [Gammaproteobacteria bacterium 39-13]|nr:thiazole synthase [Gammaproteobacteria bacterium]OJV90509.1 MAG: thiazole synthase [Gammaproteobacteria bacterium 39-13]
MWELGGKSCQSRLLIGTAGYPSLEILHQAVVASKAEIVTVSLKREDPTNRCGQRFWDIINSLSSLVLPNTAGCRQAKEAIYIAEMAREIFSTHWIKLEISGDDMLLQPDPFELLKAARTLIEMGFEVFPFCTEDYIVCQKLYDLGCHILMPWGAPIGSGKGLLNPFGLKLLRTRLPDATLIVDAGIGSPMHAMQALMLGYDAVLVNSAIAQALDPVAMASAFSLAVESGYVAHQAGIMPETDFAHASTPLEQTYFGAR